MKPLNDIESIKKKFQDLLAEKNETEGIEHDALILMSSYLAEIERVQREKDIKRNKLAALIKISASYLTQVFRGDKPLNFHTIAKIQRVLNIKFYVQAKYQNSVDTSITSTVSANDLNLEFYKNMIIKQGQYSSIKYRRAVSPTRNSVSLATSSISL